MILHLVHDDKVVPRMISLFEKYNPDKNVFICVTRKKKKELKFLHNNENIIMAYSEGEKDVPWHDIDKVIIHYYDFHKHIYLFRLSFIYGLKNFLSIWFMWGGDIYNYLERKGFVLYSTNNSYNYIRNVKISSLTFKNKCRTLFNRALDYLTYILALYFFKYKVDYIAAFDEEFRIFQDFIPFSKCRGTLKFTYYSIEETLADLYDAQSSGKAILIGNSASETNNHEYVYDYLKKLDLGDSDLFIPLNYGGSKEYIDKVVDKYKMIPNATCILDFLPLNEYNELMVNCSTFLFANFRQEAWGNILIALYLGGKVYLSRRSPLKTVCENLGFKIFVIEDIERTFHIPLSVEDKVRNRMIAKDNYSSKNNAHNILLISSLSY